jgi:hypothetical protein
MQNLKFKIKGWLAPKFIYGKQKDASICPSGSSEAIISSEPPDFNRGVNLKSQIRASKID